MWGGGIVGGNGDGYGANGAGRRGGDDGGSGSGDEGVGDGGGLMHATTKHVSGQISLKVESAVNPAGGVYVRRIVSHSCANCSCSVPTVDAQATLLSRDAPMN